MLNKQLVYATERYDYFAQALCEYAGFRAGSLERVVFPDGEAYHRIAETVRARDVVLVGGTIDDRETLELYDLACGLATQGVNTLTLVVPYFGYSTMERAVRVGEVVKAKNRAVLLSSIPRARVCNEIVLIDLHTEGIAHYFEGNMRPYHLDSARLMGDILRSFESFPDIVLASTDAGRAKWVEYLANKMDIPAAFVYKRRHSGDQTEIRGINADVRGKDVIIYDDMIRTGGSLIKAARAYLEGGAKSLTAITTHGVLPGEAMATIRNSGLFKRIIATDTHPRALQLIEQQKGPFFQVHSVVSDVADFLSSKR